VGPGEKARIRVRGGQVPELGDLIYIEENFVDSLSIYGIVCSEPVPISFIGPPSKKLQTEVFNLFTQQKERFLFTTDTYGSCLVQTYESKERT